MPKRKKAGKGHNFFILLLALPQGHVTLAEKGERSKSTHLQWITKHPTMSSPATRVLTHSQKVTRLYRKSLKHLLSWIIYRDVWRKEALELRAIFDDNKHASMGEAVKLLEEGERLFERNKHPDPYICELKTHSSRLV